MFLLISRAPSCALSTIYNANIKERQAERMSCAHARIPYVRGLVPGDPGGRLVGEGDLGECGRAKNMLSRYQNFNSGLMLNDLERTAF